MKVGQITSAETSFLSCLHIAFAHMVTDDWQEKVERQTLHKFLAPTTGSRHLRGACFRCQVACNIRGWREVMCFNIRDSRISSTY